MQMKESKEAGLFRTKQEKIVRKRDFVQVFDKINASDCDYLYVHTALSFGFPVVDKHELRKALLDIISDLGVSNIIFPTYTFSFCNNEVFDVNRSKTKMGSLNEFARNESNFRRSSDPQLSVCMKGNDYSIIENIGNYSLGPGSTFGRLDQKQKVKFMFLGTRLGDCFTYMHYLEALANVPYRYHRRFIGSVIDNDKEFVQENYLFVRHNGVNPNQASYEYEDTLLNSGILRRMPMGDSYVSVVDKDMAKEVYLNLLSKNMYHFVSGSVMSKDDSFEIRKMTAL